MAKGRATVKIKKMPMASKEDAETLNKMFEQMTGAQNADVDVIIPKYIKLHKLVSKYCKLFGILLGSDEFVELVSEHDWIEEISGFIKALPESTGTDLTKRYDESLEDMIQLKGLSECEMNTKYKNLKENSFIKQIIITGSNLAQHKKYIGDSATLDDSFINREPGLTFQPISFSSLDLKVLWSIDTITPSAKKFVLSMLSHTYNIGIEMYDVITSPDIDINKFSRILIESITKLRKQIPRCDKAFDVIENSVKLLEGNFKSYYKSSIEAENPSVIIENFIIDVSTSQNASPLVTTQFRRIVAFLKQKSSGNNDPKVKKLFSMLNSQFSAMDKELGIKTDEPAESDEKKKSASSEN
jgi:hypothetical protein